MRPEEKIKSLNDEEYNKLLYYLKRLTAKKKTYNTYRDAFLIKIMLFSGLRISEALHVKLNDIAIDPYDNEICIINIIGKGGKEQKARIVYSRIEEEVLYFKEAEELDNDDYIAKQELASYSLERVHLG